MSKKIRIWLAGLACCSVLLLLTGCKSESPTQTVVSETPGTTQTTYIEPDVPTSTPVPVPTEVPLAIRINSFEITMMEYQAELDQFKAAKGSDLTSEDEKRVQDDLIDQSLLAKAAGENAFTVDSKLLEERSEALITQLGGAQALEDWKTKYGYDDTTFHQALRRSIAAVWMRDQIATSVENTADQVHVRQILLYNPGQAEEVYEQLKAGNSFQNLALKYDPITGGDLGWFPKGFLSDKEIEEAAFTLQPGQYSAIIKTSAGYHILQVLERDPARPLSPDALQALQIQAIADWIKQQREQNKIEILLP